MVAQNSAAGAGAGVYVTGTQAALLHTTIARNGGSGGWVGDASAVGLVTGTVYAGANDGLYSYNGTGWIKAGNLHHPVARIFGDSEGVRAVTRGAGTWYLK